MQTILLVFLHFLASLHFLAFSNTRCRVRPSRLKFNMKSIWTLLLVLAFAQLRGCTAQQNVTTTLPMSPAVSMLVSSSAPEAGVAAVPERG